jgi:hypothetical protein
VEVVLHLIAIVFPLLILVGQAKVLLRVNLVGLKNLIPKKRSGLAGRHWQKRS